MPELSVIVPVYNVGYLVKKCIESLINQSFSDLEIIIINDGSSDDSSEYITPYLADKRIKYINNHINYGLGYARNIGLENATGKYITFVDSDDWVDLDLYKLMLKNIQSTQSDITICGIKNEFNNYMCTEERYVYSHPNIISNYVALNILSRCENNNYMISPVVWNKIYKKSLIIDNDITFIDNSYWEDDVFTFQIFMNSQSISIVQNVYYHYYQREKSITNDFSKKHIDDIICAFKKLYTYIENSNRSCPDLKNIANSFFDRAISSMMHMLFCNEPSIKKQKEYIIYFYDQFSNTFSIAEAIAYLDMQRIRNLFI